MTAGYAGKILSINLTNRSITTLATEQYEEFGGGNGIGAALFWELCRNKAISGLDPGNVVTVMTSPLSGTLAPASRLEICGNSPFAYPVEWFSRSSIGGFFGAMLKYAGWDGIVIGGKADKPVWINILNDKVTIEDAGGLWGLDTLATQEEIWRRVTGQDSFGEWLSLGEAQTTQGPSVLCIGPGGESLSRMGTIQHGNGMAAGLGGFGGAWGAKNLKAISVLGTGGIRVAYPDALIAARERLRAILERGPAHGPGLPELREPGRQTSCAGCFQKCKSRVQSGVQNDAQCLETLYVTDIPPGGKSGSDIIQTHGLMINDVAPLSFTAGAYINRLYEAGVLGPGKTIDSAPLPMEEFGNVAFVEALCRAIVNREGIGADLAEGLMRAAQKWGRLEQDLASGLLDKSQWGYGWHWSLPFLDQAYGSLMGDRDVNEHAFMFPIWGTLKSIGEDKLLAEKAVEFLSKKFIPYTGDPFMFDFSWQEADGSNMKQALATGIYSKHKAKLIAWHRHYTRFWEESMLYCDFMWPRFFDVSAPDFVGYSPEFEPRFYNAVTGQNLSFADGVEIGRKVWNLNRAIWVLQGRHRDMENFAEFMYTPAGSLINYVQNIDIDNPPLTVYKNGKWVMTTLENLYLDKAGVEQWKTNFYKVEGWDTKTGWPTRKTLEELGLKKVADILERAGRLGSPG